MAALVLIGLSGQLGWGAKSPSTYARARAGARPLTGARDGKAANVGKRARTTPTCMTPTHTLRVSHVTDTSPSPAWGWVGSRCLTCSVPIQKLMLLRRDSKSLSSHLHERERWGRVGKEREGEEVAVEE